MQLYLNNIIHKTEDVVLFLIKITPHQRSNNINQYVGQQYQIKIGFQYDSL